VVVGDAPRCGTAEGMVVHVLVETAIDQLHDQAQSV